MEIGLPHVYDLWESDLWERVKKDELMNGGTLAEAQPQLT
jgi:hypothetical protein